MCCFSFAGSLCSCGHLSFLLGISLDIIVVCLPYPWTCLCNPLEVFGLSLYMFVLSFYVFVLSLCVLCYPFDIHVLVLSCVRLRQEAWGPGPGQGPGLGQGLDPGQGRARPGPGKPNKKGEKFYPFIF